jgi:hypothetical protein
MDAGKLEVVALPPAYSEVDRERRCELLGRLSALEREYQWKCEPLLDALVRIDAGYPPRFTALRRLRARANGEGT